MRTIDAESLTRNNLAYREPALYDELLGDDSLPDDIRDIAARENNPARSILDLGCGTARLLAELFRHGITGAGIDVQPGLIHWARTQHPALWLEVADLRTARLDTTFDLIVCLGNTLSYMHTDPELAAAFTIAAAHSHPGTLLAVATLTGTGRDATTSSDISTSIGPATVDTTSEWNPIESMLTTRRTWQFNNGRTEQDTMRRRIWSIDDISRCARAAGFDIAPIGPVELTLCARIP